MKMAARIRRFAGLSAASVGLSALLVAGSAAQAPIFVLRAGDAVDGGAETVAALGTGVVSSSGQWAVLARTNSTDRAADQVLMRDGVLSVREGSSVASPAGAAVDGFGPMDLDDAGNIFQVYYLSGTSGVGDDTGLYRNGALLLQEGMVSGAPQFGAGTTYRGFLNVKCNGSGTVAALVAAVNDPAVAGDLEIAVIRLDLSGGAVTGETVIAKQGDVLAGQTQPVTGFGTGLHQLAVNEPGGVLYFADLAGDPAVDGTIYLDGTLVAQEGGAAPDPGRTYELLRSRGLDVNDLGEAIFHADLDDSDTSDDAALVWADSIVVREGDPPPGLPLPGSFVHRDFGAPSSAVAVDNGGNVAYSAHAGPAANPFPFLASAGQYVILRQFIMIEGETILDVYTAAGQYSLSAANGWTLFRVLGGTTQTSFNAFAIAPGPLQGPVDAPAVAGAADGPGLQAFPNPAPNAVQIRFALDRDAPVTLRVFDVTGRRVATLADQAWPAGSHAVAWGGTNEAGRRAAPGTYFVRLNIGDRRYSTRVTLVD